MNSKVNTIITLVLSGILLTGICYALLLDLNFIITKKNTNAKIIRIQKNVKDNKLYFQVKYFNDFVNSNIDCLVKLGVHDGNVIANKYNAVKEIEISYGKNFPYKVYIENLNTPGIGMIIFEIIMGLIMLFTAISCLKNLKRKVIDAI